MLRAVRSCAFFTATLIAVAAWAAPRPLSLRKVVLDLPAPPARIASTDLDGDGRTDLLVVTASSTWGSVSEDRVEAAIMIAEVVPALFEKREVHAFIAAADGTYRALPPLEIGDDVHSVEAGPAQLPAIAVTDDGVSAFRIERGEQGERLTLTPWLAARTVLSESGTFLSHLTVIRDVDGDGHGDLVLPQTDGLAIYRGSGGTFETTPAFRGRLPGDRAYATDRAQRSIPYPRFEDLDGDGKKELIVLQQKVMHVFRGLGECRFAAARKIRLDCLGLGVVAQTKSADEDKPQYSRSLSFMGDLEGDRKMELVTRVQKDSGKGDFKQFQEPIFEYRVHRIHPDFSIESNPARTFEVKGYASSGNFLDLDASDFRDLDGDKRMDLVVITFDVSMFQALRVLTTKKMSIGLSFEVWVQSQDGSFAQVPKQALDEKLTFDFNDFQIGRLAEFAGDFDGDGRIDFIHLGRGRSVAIRRGQPGARYPVKPDLEITLDEAPEDLALVRVEDLDGDGRADLAITRTRGQGDDGATAPAALELRLSREAK